jgi:hypothetical protein
MRFCIGFGEPPLHFGDLFIRKFVGLRSHHLLSLAFASWIAYTPCTASPSFAMLDLADRGAVGKHRLVHLGGDGDAAPEIVRQFIAGARKGYSSLTSGSHSG